MVSSLNPRSPVPGPPAGLRPQAHQTVVILAFQYGTYLTEAILLVPDHVVGIDRRIEAVFRATADGDACRLHHQAILCRVPPAPAPGECILSRSQAYAAQHPSVALPQGWMAILLNLICANGTVPMLVVGKRKSLDVSNKQGVSSSLYGFKFYPGVSVQKTSAVEFQQNNLGCHC